MSDDRLTTGQLRQRLLARLDRATSFSTRPSPFIQRSSGAAPASGPSFPERAVTAVERRFLPRPVRIAYINLLLLMQRHTALQALHRQVDDRDAAIRHLLRAVAARDAAIHRLERLLAGRVPAPDGPGDVPSPDRFQNRGEPSPPDSEASCRALEAKRPDRTPGAGREGM